MRTMDKTLGVLLDMQDAPTLVQIISRCAERLENSDELSRALEGVTNENDETEELPVRMWSVWSESGNGMYDVFFDPDGPRERDRWRCTCADSLFRRDGVCKHILKVEGTEAGERISYREFREYIDAAYMIQKEGKKAQARTYDKGWR